MSTTMEIIATAAISSVLTLSGLQMKELAREASEVSSRGWEQRVATAEAMGFEWSAQARREIEDGKLEATRLVDAIPEVE